MYCGDGTCTRASSVNENCNNCPQDCGLCPVDVEEEDDGVGSIMVEEEVGEIEIPPEEPRNPAGVGWASSMFRSIATNPWIIILFMLILAGLYVGSFKKDAVMKKMKGRKKINWKGYFDK